jgi:hypothetical protein
VPFTHVLVNSNLAPAVPAAWGVTRPAADPEEREELAALGVEVLEADVVDAARPTRHDPEKLARALLAAYARLRPVPGASPFSAVRAWTGVLSPAPPQSLSAAGVEGGARRR